METSAGGRRILDERKARGWTQQDLANRAGIAIKTVSTAENGGSVNRNSLKHIARALGISVEDLQGAAEVAS